MNLHTFLFYTLAGLTSGCAIAMVVTQNIVRAAAWLLFTLAGVAGVFFLLGAEFVGATQLLVYVGGTLVLVVFGVMLTAQGPFINMKTGAGEWAISLFVGAAFYAVLALSILSAAPMQKDSAHTGVEMTPTTEIGISFLGKYLLPFEIVSVHLLVVLIGAAYLARTKRRRGTPS